MSEPVAERGGPGLAELPGGLGTRPDYRHELRPVTTTGADVMDKSFSEATIPAAASPPSLASPPIPATSPSLVQRRC